MAESKLLVPDEQVLPTTLIQRAHRNVLDHDPGFKITNCDLEACLASESKLAAPHLSREDFNSTDDRDFSSASACLVGAPGEIASGLRPLVLHFAPDRRRALRSRG
jgi:hypothetical protein